MVVCVASMTAGSSTFQYALGSTDAEHERLTRQAQWVNPHTEQCFREAGISLGCRVLDIGSGVGDVALLLARLVGPAGEVVSVERDTRSIRRAVDKDWPWGPTNNYCKWFHVCEHEAHHTGQIAFLRKRLPGAKPDSD
jgi:SAM-dependent methyltransferase